MEELNENTIEHLKQMVNTINIVSEFEEKNRILQSISKEVLNGLSDVDLYIQTMYYGGLQVENADVNEAVRSLIIGVRAAFIMGYIEGIKFNKPTTVYKIGNAA